MNGLKMRATVIAVLGALGLAACGGSGTTASSGATTTASGVITGFGSVFVNGVEYETGGTSVSVDGVAGSENELAVGMVVTIEGSVNPDGVTGTASHIEFSDELQGVVLANNIAPGASAGTLDIMGQTVSVTADTVFESKVAGITSVDLVAAGNIVEVSGYSDGKGSIYATLIEVKKAARDIGDEVEFKGVIQGLDTNNQTFLIGALTVDYSGADVSDLPNGLPADGLYVEVKSTDGIAGGQLIASKVELEDGGAKGVQAAEGEEVELAGMVTGTDALPGGFQLNGQAVLLTDETEFEHGTLGDIVPEARLKVEGRVDAEGNLVAHEVKFRESATIEITAQLEAVDATAGTVTVMGQTIQVNTRTMMRDSRDEGGMTPVRYFSLNDLNPGDYVEIHVYKDSATGALVAVRLERDDDPGTLATLEGPVDDASVSGQMTVAGITVDITGVSGFTPTVGAKVEVKGTYNGSGTLVASEASQ